MHYVLLWHQPTNPTDLMLCGTQPKKVQPPPPPPPSRTHNSPRVWLRIFRPSSPRQAFRASNGFVNCTKAYPLCIEMPAKNRRTEQHISVAGLYVSWGRTLDAAKNKAIVLPHYYRQAVHSAETFARRLSLSIGMCSGCRQTHAN